MNREFAIRLEEFLSSECKSYNLTYDWDYEDGTSYCEVEIKKGQLSKFIIVKFNKDSKELEMETDEGCSFTINENDYTVKYFWIEVVKGLFIK